MAGIDDLTPPITWCRQARHHYVVDGDTVDLWVDLGWSMQQKVRFRLNGVDTPELRSSDPEERRLAKEAKQFVLDWLTWPERAHEWPLVVLSTKTGKYGRWLGTVWRVGEDESLNARLIREGFAIPYG